MVMSATALVATHPNLTEDEVRRQLDGNLCRCTGYHNIVKAVVQGAAGMQADASSKAATTV
jgi:carbon-monoxide dehydrogenase small subunit